MRTKKTTKAIAVAKSKEFTKEDAVALGEKLAMELLKAPPLLQGAVMEKFRVVLHVDMQRRRELFDQGYKDVGFLSDAMYSDIAKAVAQ